MSIRVSSAALRQERGESLISGYTALWCCRRFEARIRGISNFSLAWLTGTTSNKTNNALDHTKSEQHMNMVCTVKTILVYRLYTYSLYYRCMVYTILSDRLTYSTKFSWGKVFSNWLNTFSRFCFRALSREYRPCLFPKIEIFILLSL